MTREQMIDEAVLKVFPRIILGSYLEGLRALKLVIEGAEIKHIRAHFTRIASREANK